MQEDNDVSIEIWGRNEWDIIWISIAVINVIILQSKWGSMNDINEDICIIHREYCIG